MLKYSLSLAGLLLNLIKERERERERKGGRDGLPVLQSAKSLFQ